MNHPQLETVFKACQAVLGIKWKKKDRRIDYVYKRAIFYRVARDLTGASLSQIGDLVDRDHATVMHGLKRFKTDIEEGYGNNPNHYQELHRRCHKHSENKLNQFKETEWSYEQRLVHENINLRSENKTLKQTIKTLVA